MKNDALRAVGKMAVYEHEVSAARECFCPRNEGGNAGYCDCSQGLGQMGPARLTLKFCFAVSLYLLPGGKYEVYLNSCQHFVFR